MTAKAAVISSVLIAVVCFALWVFHMAFSPHVTIPVAGNGETSRLSDVATGKERAIFQVSKPKSGDVKSSPDSTVAHIKKIDLSEMSADASKDNQPRSEGTPAPPKEFRTGNVTPGSLDAAALKKTASGFEVQLPSHAPIPTPTVYQGKIYVSGGFHSNQYYCFDEATGKLVWAANLDDNGPTSAACMDGICVFNTESCTIFALDADTGKQRWSYWLGDPMTSTPTIANGKVFTSYPTGDRAVIAPAGNKSDDPAETTVATHVLACLDLKTGAILWQRWLDSDVMSASVAVGDDLYATSFAGTLYIFRQTDGAMLSSSRSRGTSAPVIVSGIAYLTQRADTDPNAPAEERFAAVAQARAVPAGYRAYRRSAGYLDRRVQAASRAKKRAATADQANGLGQTLQAAANVSAAWSNVGVGNISSMQAFQGSRILHYEGSNFNCMGNEVLCTDPTSGKVKWSVKVDGDLQEMGGFLASAPTAAGGKIFLTTIHGQLLQMNPASGKTEVRYEVGSPVQSQPAIQGGRAYIGTLDGKLVCIDTGHPEFTGWNTWGANAAHTNLVEKLR